MTPDVREIVIERLVTDGFDGLYSSCGECACTVDDFAPCGNIQSDCSAGYQITAPDGSEHDFLIVPERPAGHVGGGK